MPLSARESSRESDPDPQTDRMASFQGMTSPQESPDLKDAIVQFYIDTLGRPRFLGSKPDDLSGPQIEILKATFARSPSWTPAIQKGRKVKIKYVLPLNHQL